MTLQEKNTKKAEGFRKLGGLSMYAFFQPRISVEQEEADIKAMIDKEYEQREQEHIDYYKQMEEDYYKQMEEDYYKQMENRV